MIGLSSCSTIPHTNSEKYWLGAMIAANTGDVLYTKYKLDQGGEYREANPIFEDKGIETLIAGKIISMGIIYELGQLYPESRKLLYKISTIVNVLITGWNIHL